VLDVALQPKVVGAARGDDDALARLVTWLIWVMGDPAGTRYVASISQYAAVNVIFSARAGSAPILPISHTSLSTASASSPGFGNGTSFTGTPSLAAIARAMSGETPSDRLRRAPGDQQEIRHVDAGAQDAVRCELGDDLWRHKGGSLGAGGG